MIELNIPGKGVLRLEHLVCDVNGTLAIDGSLIDGVKRALATLKDRLHINLITADTYSQQYLIDQALGLQAVRLKPGSEIDQKAEFVRQLGKECVVAIGQGANDSGMLNEAALGICILSPEGLAVSSLMAADILVPDLMTAFDLLKKPLRIIATLRK
jgi:P-type E1-E2 ATPase